MNVVLLKSLGTLAIFANFFDSWTTHRCLYKPFEGYIVVEANPFAQFIFNAIGLGPGLLLDLAITIGLILLVTQTRIFSDWAKVLLLLLLGLPPAYAAWNNYQVMQMIGSGWFF